MDNWSNCQNILCLRPDNMGDLLMSVPAMKALKETFRCNLTLLTSPMAEHIAKYIPCVDETIVWQVPWVKGGETVSMVEFDSIVRLIREKCFDAAVIFTVFSQNPLPSALIVALAGIPMCLAYCRENPYRLLSHWVEEKEPYTLLRHQVRRDLQLVQSVGARVTDHRITLSLPADSDASLERKMIRAGLNPEKLFLIIHPGASEEKRQCDPDLWIEAGRRLTDELGYQVIITGVEKESTLANKIRYGIGRDAISLAGHLSLEEMMSLIRLSPLLISVNTGPVHLAAALQTKVIVLYALTNPQHTPWKAVGRILPFTVSDEFASRNEILRFVQKKYYGGKKYCVTPDDVLSAARELLTDEKKPLVDELVLPAHSSFTASGTL